MLVIPATQDAACSEEQEFRVILGCLLVKALTQNISKQRKTVRNIAQCKNSFLIPMPWFNSQHYNKQTNKASN